VAGFIVWWKDGWLYRIELGVVEGWWLYRIELGVVEGWLPL